MIWLPLLNYGRYLLFERGRGCSRRVRDETNCKQFCSFITHEGMQPPPPPPPPRSASRSPPPTHPPTATLRARADARRPAVGDGPCCAPSQSHHVLPRRRQLEMGLAALRVNLTMYEVRSHRRKRIIVIAAIRVAVRATIRVAIRVAIRVKIQYTVMAPAVFVARPLARPVMAPIGEGQSVPLGPRHWRGARQWASARDRHLPARAPIGD